MTEYHDHRDDCPFKFATLDVCDCVEKNMLDRIKALTEQLAAARDDAKEAEDYAEELEAKLATCEKYRDAYAECDRIWTQTVRDLEAKLAKAVEALDMLVRDCEADYPPSHVAIKYFAIGALAEIKGESHE